MVTQLIGTPTMRQDARPMAIHPLQVLTITPIGTVLNTAYRAYTELHTTTHLRAALAGLASEVAAVKLLMCGLFCTTVIRLAFTTTTPQQCFNPGNYFCRYLTPGHSYLVCALARAHLALS